MERTDCVELIPCPFCGSEAYAYEIPPHKHVIPMGIPDCGGEFLIPFYSSSLLHFLSLFLTPLRYILYILQKIVRYIGNIDTI